MTLERQYHGCGHPLVEHNVPWIQKPHAKDKPLPPLNPDPPRPTPPSSYRPRSALYGPRHTLHPAKNPKDLPPLVDTDPNLSLGMAQLPPSLAHTPSHTPPSHSPPTPTKTRPCEDPRCPPAHLGFSPNRPSRSMYAKRRSLPVCTAQVTSLDTLQRALTIGAVPAYEGRRSMDQCAPLSGQRTYHWPANPSPLYRLNAYSTSTVALPAPCPPESNAFPMTDGEKKELLLHDDGAASHRHDHRPLTYYHTIKMRVRDDRIAAYNKAYEDCVRATSGLVPWTTKQTKRDQPHIMSVCAPRPAVPRQSSIRTILLPILGMKRNNTKTQPCVMDWPDYLVSPTRKEPTGKLDLPQAVFSPATRPMSYQKPNHKCDDDNDTVTMAPPPSKSRLEHDMRHALDKASTRSVRQQLMTRPRSCNQPTHSYFPKQALPLRAQSTSVITRKSVNARWA